MTLRNVRCVDLAFVFVLAAALLLPASISAQSGNYSFVNIDYPGAYQTVPEAINDSGAIVGYYLDSQYGNWHGFLYAGGVYTTIDDPAGTTFPEGINNSGVIVGLYECCQTQNHGFTYENGVFTTFDYPGSSGATSGEGINNSNEIVGIYSPGGDDGFLDNNGSFSPLKYPGADDTYPHAISNTGHVVGYYTVSTNPFGFVYDGSTFTSIDYPSGYETFAYGINDAGVVVGYSNLNSPTYEVGFLWQAGQFTVINSDAYPQPSGINNNGQIVGTYTPSNEFHGFLATPSSSPQLQFNLVLPCRVVDTRNPDGTFGGPTIQGGTFRSFPIPQGACDIPATAAAYSLNVTLVPYQGNPVGYLTIWPQGENQPVASLTNSVDGRVKANAAIIPAGVSGGVSVFVSNTADVVLDIDGYFTLPGNSTLAFYPLTPCRVADTRSSNYPQGLGAPSLSASVPRDFPILNSSCIPQGVSPQAYSFNFTAVPPGPLGYLTVWPAGLQQPGVSTLNDVTGTVVANAAIVPAGENGDIDAFASNNTDLVIDINGYFAPPGQGGLSLYPMTPCRVLDTRNGKGKFVGELTVDTVDSVCGPSNLAQAYVFNATVVPPAPLGYLTLWPDGGTQPGVSTLNAIDGAVTSNMAIVPTTNGSIDAFASNLTQLVLDIYAFFAP